MRRLYLEPTSMCNLRCKTCFRNNWFDEKQGIMCDGVLSEVYRYINSAKNLESVMLAGMGEPLLHEKTLQIVKEVSSAGKKAEILTNATLLDERMCQELIDAGLDILWVSADIPHAESADTEFSTVVKNIEYFNSLRKGFCRLGLTFVVTDPDISRIKDFADKLCCDSLNISGAIPSSPIKEMCSLNTILCQGSTDFKNHCPFIEEDMCFVKWNGDVSPCMQLLHNSYTYFFEEKRKVYSYSFGNVREKSLDDIWNSVEYREFRKKVKSFEFPDCTLCDGCDDRLENKTDCMFNSAPTCGACLWAQNIARCP